MIGLALFEFLEKREGCLVRRRISPASEDWRSTLESWRRWSCSRWCTGTCMLNLISDRRAVYCSTALQVMPNASRCDLDLSCFYSPSGTGKTLVASALATECSNSERKVSFISRKGSDCLSKWVGESEKKLEKIFSLVGEVWSLIIPCAYHFNPYDIQFKDKYLNLKSTYNSSLKLGYLDQIVESNLRE